ncbi:PRC-barrel domain-containing protein [Jannaschia sp. S6380]|uniref:PRC-barrel domain-containing protein n=1 Tax=Jannaschia sp. S6380 TaxID=2926408 RepID=UPI001FF14500|nr:PRC-barrel domain-containing protein [Jannaschia sp. S6380]MCK0167399.1 PRC-barrel domain-containing protein [Jannaschia sp. S6380]
MKTLVASTAIAMAVFSPALAETHRISPFVASIETEALRTSDLVGARLYVTEAATEAELADPDTWEDVGEISDVVLGNAGEMDVAIADIGGFLGLGERRVAVNMDDLLFLADTPEGDTFRIVLPASRTDLESAPEFNDRFAYGRTRAAVDVRTEGSGLTTQAGVTNDTTAREVENLDSGTVIDNEKTPATAVIQDGQVVTTSEDETPVGTD